MLPDGGWVLRQNRTVITFVLVLIENIVRVKLLSAAATVLIEQKLSAEVVDILYAEVTLDTDLFNSLLVSSRQNSIGSITDWHRLLLLILEPPAPRT